MPNRATAAIEALESVHRLLASCGVRRDSPEAVRAYELVGMVTNRCGSTEDAVLAARNYLAEQGVELEADDGPPLEGPAA